MLKDKWLGFQYILKTCILRCIYYPQNWSFYFKKLEVHVVLPSVPRALSFPDFGGVSSAGILAVVAATSVWSCGQEAGGPLGRWMRTCPRARSSSMQRTGARWACSLKSILVCFKNKHVLLSYAGRKILFWAWEKDYARSSRVKYECIHSAFTSGLFQKTWLQKEWEWDTCDTYRSILSECYLYKAS